MCQRIYCYKHQFLHLSFSHLDRLDMCHSPCLHSMGDSIEQAYQNHRGLRSGTWCCVSQLYQRCFLQVRWPVLFHNNSASISTIVRLKLLLNYNSVSDYLYGVANIALWSVVELGSGLIAGSMATLRPLFKFIPFLRSSRSGSGKGASAPHGYGNRSHKLETFGTGRGTNPGYRTLTEGGKSEERGSDGDSQRHILKETEVTITTDELSSVPQTGHVGMAYSGNTAMIQGNEDIMVSDPEHGYPRHGARH